MPVTIFKNIAQTLAIAIYVHQNKLDHSGSDEIIFIDNTTSNKGDDLVLLTQYITHNITFNQRAKPSYQIVNNQLSFTHYASYKYPKSVTIHQILSLGSELHKATKQDIFQNLFIMEYASYPLTTIISKLNFTQTVVGYKHHPTNDIINLIDNLLLKIVLHHPILDTIIFDSNVRVQKNDNPDDCGYFGVDLTHIEDNPVTAPGIYVNTLGVKRNRVELIFTKPNNPTLTITLRSPDFGDSNKNQQNRLYHRTRGGSLLVYRDAIWPQIETLTYKISIYKCDNQYNTDGTLNPSYRELNPPSIINQIFDFLQQSLGQEITLIDHYTRTWTGLITNPNTAIEQVGRFEYTISIEFEGKLTVGT